MSRTVELGAALFNTEASWAESASVFGTRVQTIGKIDVSGLQQAKLNPAYTTQLRNEIKPGVNGVYGGEFSIEMRLTGHGSSTSTGAITLNALEMLLGNAFGNVAAACATGGTTATTGSTTTALKVAAVSGYNAGSLIPVGTIGDGRGNGQFYAVQSHATSTINLLNATPAVLNTGDVVRNSAMIYTTESPQASHAVQSTRWRFLSGNMQYECRGCYIKAVAISQISPSEEPTVKFTFGVSYFTEVSVAFPDTTSVQTFPHAAVSCGSLFLNKFGISTRDATSNLLCRHFTLTINLNVKPRMGTGGQFANQVCVGATRGRDTYSAEIVVDAPDATITPDFLTKWSENSPLHLLYVLNAVDGQANALYSPYCVPDGPHPVQVDQDGINSLKLQMRLGADASKATDLERSALRWASA